MEKFKALLAVALFVAALLFSAFETESKQNTSVKPASNQQPTPKSETKPTLLR